MCRTICPETSVFRVAGARRARALGGCRRAAWRLSGTWWDSRGRAVSGLRGVVDVLRSPGPWLAAACADGAARRTGFALSSPSKGPPELKSIFRKAYRGPKPGCLAAISHKVILSCGSACNCPLLSVTLSSVSIRILSGCCRLRAP